MIAEADVAVQVLWDVLLLVVIAGVVPLVLHLAARLVRAAKAIEVHFATTLAAAAGVVQNTAPTTPALSETISVAGTILAVAGDIDAHSAAIEELLEERAARGAAR